MSCWSLLEPKIRSGIFVAHWILGYMPNIWFCLLVNQYSWSFLKMLLAPPSLILWFDQNQKTHIWPSTQTTSPTRGLVDMVDPLTSCKQRFCSLYSNSCLTLYLYLSHLLFLLYISSHKYITLLSSHYHESYIVFVLFSMVLIEILHLQSINHAYQSSCI